MSNLSCPHIHLSIYKIFLSCVHDLDDYLQSDKIKLFNVKINYLGSFNFVCIYWTPNRFLFLLFVPKFTMPLILQNSLIGCFSDHTINVNQQASAHAMNTD
ncbi:hypothetical protein BpHYR1_048433 [Brachionus plicatilis]|uniref:Uncharacterized protein n=1 Tax=Brachionus plicatilis TaxID=10195 RepID=A0A3M7SSP9_BRAPC|nr:hypothetical protein BpHYR1_048433 [Brachionus plicatilis]